MIKLCKFNFYVSLYGKCIVRRQEPMKIEFKKPLLYDVLMCTTTWTVNLLLILSVMRPLFIFK